MSWRVLADQRLKRGAASGDNDVTLSVSIPTKSRCLRSNVYAEIVLCRNDHAATAPKPQRRIEYAIPANLLEYDGMKLSSRLGLKTEMLDRLALFFSWREVT